MGESKSEAGRFGFDGHLRFCFRGAKITTDAGLLAVRELDEVMGLTEMAGGMIAEARGANRQHDLTGLLRQSIIARLAGYEDVNDQEALSRDPAMRAIAGRRALEKNAASSATVARFETEILAGEANTESLAAINGAWVKRAAAHSEAKKAVLDMDSSESPVHGGQEGSAYNGHFHSTCYHPLFCFNQAGDSEGAVLRPGNVPSADGWRELLEPIVDRYKDTGKKLYFRADAAFASPKGYEYLEEQGVLYALRMPANGILYGEIEHLLKRPVGRPPAKPQVFYHDFLYRAGSWDRTRRIIAKVISHSRRTVFQLAEVAASGALFTKILARIHGLRYAPT